MADVGRHPGLGPLDHLLDHALAPIVDEQILTHLEGHPRVERGLARRQTGPLQEGLEPLRGLLEGLDVPVPPPLPDQANVLSNLYFRCGALQQELEERTGLGVEPLPAAGAALQVLLVEGVDGDDLRPVLFSSRNVPIPTLCVPVRGETVVFDDGRIRGVIEQAGTDLLRIIGVVAILGSLFGAWEVWRGRMFAPREIVDRLRR